MNNEKLTKDEWRIGRMLDLNPNDTERWPMDIVRRLLALEKHRGPEALVREIHRMMSRY